MKISTGLVALALSAALVKLAYASDASQEGLIAPAQAGAPSVVLTPQALRSLTPAQGVQEFSGMGNSNPPLCTSLQLVELVVKRSALIAACSATNATCLADPKTRSMGNCVIAKGKL